MNERRLVDAIFAQAEHGPERTALVDGERKLTYGDLVQKAWRLAAALTANGLMPGDRAALLVGKSFDAITMMLGCAAAGVIYVPIDVGSPAARAAKIVQAADPGLVLLAPDTQKLWLEIAALLPARTFALGALADHPFQGVACRFTGRDLASSPAKAPAWRGSADEPVHLLFTSGSTGTPKGVVITHKNVLAYLDWALAHFGVRAEDRCSSHPPLHFDLSTFDVYGTLTAGAELHLVGENSSLLPHKLAQWIRDSQLTQWFSVPSILTYLLKFQVLLERDFPSLRRVLWCGEALPTPTLIEWMKRVPHARFTNLYGPTEATIASTYHDVSEVPRDPQEPIPIGRACAGEEALVLDDKLYPVPVGELGEICLAGVGLSPGYWRDPEKTGQAFVTDPLRPQRKLYRTGDLGRIDAAGVLHFAGRKDTQIKCRGYRIELGEIEAALHTLSFLEESAVVAIASDGFEGSTICCAYATYDRQKVTPAIVRKELARLVPNYMLPSRWLHLDSLPKNQNGKIDRPNLRARFIQEVASP